MYLYNCQNPISEKGTSLFTKDYQETKDVKDADAILVRSARLHEMQFHERLLAVARAGAGVNNIPIQDCAEHGIVVFNTPGANANAVKEMVFAGMLLAGRDIIGGNEWVAENADDKEIASAMEKAKKNYAGTELYGKKLGVIGLGAIGVRVANAATHFGMEVYGYDPFISVRAAWNLSRSVRHIDSVQDIYKQCDYITIHVPLMDDTRRMINKEALEMMKDGVVILNFARDLLVDEPEVLAAIERGKVRKYVSDFPNTTTAGKKGVILTPHLGASTAEAEDNCAVMAVEQIMDYLENGNIINSVNFPDCDMGRPPRAGRVAIMHQNVRGVIAQYTKIMGDDDINVSDMFNKTRGTLAYAMLDLDTPVTKKAIEKLNKIPEVIRVRVIK
ncbi:MAG: phosphoglycerate dehydrogenase [Lachnospiraceae bacterium]|nr:phosphoglycerate dehydrogenase [Lachnospiraceae bacterium]